MKTIYTSYFARHAQHPNAIAICCILTSWVRDNAGFRGEHRPELGPTWEMVKQAKQGYMTHEQFAEQYIQTLHNRGFTPQSIVDRLPENAILLCYETPQDFCHRHVLTDWLKQHQVDAEIRELLTEDEQRQQEQHQFVETALEW